MYQWVDRLSRVIEPSSSLKRPKEWVWALLQLTLSTVTATGAVVVSGVDFVAKEAILEVAWELRRMGGRGQGKGLNESEEGVVVDSACADEVGGIDFW
jgi:hypothetical protein